MIYDLQKANMLKRFMAFLLDFIILIILITGFMWVLSSATNYSTYSESLSTQIQDIEKSYGIPSITEEYEVTTDSYSVMTKDERDKLPEEVRNTLESCIKEINSNQEISKTYMKVISLMLMMVSVSILLSVVILEFIVPLCLKNGQTIGKKIFSLAVMRIDGVRATPLIMFARSILGKYTVEIMIPTMLILMLFFGMGSIVTIAVVILIALFELILVIATKTNSLIHDILAATVVVDYQSQMIFDSVEAKEEYQLRIHSEDAKNSKYF